jgi:hypothetical protein
MQVCRIGRVAPQSEGLSSPWRRPLPRHRILHRGFKCSAVWWRYLQGHFHLPSANRRKREFFGMNHPGDAQQPPIAGRRPCRPRCAHRYQYCACQHCRGGNGEFHDVFPVWTRSQRKASEDLVNELAWSADENQDGLVDRFCKIDQWDGSREGLYPSYRPRPTGSETSPSLICLGSNPITGFPDEKNEGRDQSGYDKHPVLTFESQKSKMLNQKLQRSRPHFCAT